VTTLDTTECAATGAAMLRATQQAHAGLGHPTADVLKDLRRV